MFIRVAAQVCGIKKPEASRTRLSLGLQRSCEVYGFHRSCGVRREDDCSKGGPRCAFSSLNNRLSLLSGRSPSKSRPQSKNHAPFASLQAKQKTHSGRRLAHRWRRSRTEKADRSDIGKVGAAAEGRTIHILDRHLDFGSLYAAGSCDSPEPRNARRFLHPERLVSTLVDMAQPQLASVFLPSPDMGDRLRRCMEDRQLTIALRPHKQVPVVSLLCLEKWKQNGTSIIRLAGT